MQAFGAVETGRPQLDPLEVGVVDQVGPISLSWKPRPVTTPSTKRTSAWFTPSWPAATTASRSRIWSQASLTAPPLMSDPELAAVAEVFGTLSVRVGASRTRLIGTPSAVAATWIILVCSP